MEQFLARSRACRAAGSRGWRVLLGCSLAAAVAAGARPVQADAGVWDGPPLSPGNGFGGRTPAWVDLSADTIHHEWNLFTNDGGDPVYIIDNTPDVAAFGPAPRQVRENTGGAFVTGGGNIYSFAIATDFTATLGGYPPGPAAPRTVALRLATLGTELDYASVRLNGIPGARYETFRQSISNEFGAGAEVESLWLWTVQDAASYVFNFTAQSSSLSLDQLAAYVGPKAVPSETVPALPVWGQAVLALLLVWQIAKAARGAKRARW